MQIPPTLMLNQRPSNRRPRQRRNTDPEKHKRNPSPPICRILIRREAPDSRIIQPLHSAGREAIEAGYDRDGRLSFSCDPDEEEEGCEEDGWDDGVDVAEAAVGEEGREKAAREVGRVYEDEEGDG